MNAPEFVAEMTAAAEHLTAEQRVLASRFVATLADHAGVELAKAHRNRREGERLWEENQLAGLELERRRREP